MIEYLIECTRALIGIKAAGNEGTPENLRAGRNRLHCHTWSTLMPADRRPRIAHARHGAYGPSVSKKVADGSSGALWDILRHSGNDGVVPRFLLISISGASLPADFL